MLYTYGRNSWQGSSKLPASCKLQGSHAIHRTGGVNGGHGQEKEVLFWFISCRPARRRNAWEQWIMFNELHRVLVWRGPLACLMCSFKLTAQHSTTKFADSSFQYQTKETYYFPPQDPCSLSGGAFYNTFKLRQVWSVRKKRMIISKPGFFFFSPHTSLSKQFIQTTFAAELLDGERDGGEEGVYRRVVPRLSWPFLPLRWKEQTKKKTQMKEGTVSLMTEHI